MKLEDVPLVAFALKFGSDDRVYNALMIAGPLVIVIVAAAERNIVTQGLAVAYVLLFLSHVFDQSVRPQP